MGFISFQNNFKDLAPSCKMDVDLLDCLGEGSQFFSELLKLDL